MEYDSIIVHGQKVKDNGSLNEAVKGRIDTSLDFYFEGEAPVLICSGGYTNPRANVSEAASMRNYALHKGVDEKSIFLEEKSKETIGNAFFTKVSYLEPNRWQKNIVVSSDWHLPRLGMVFERVLGENYYTKLVGSRDDITEDELKKLKQKEKFWYHLDNLILLGIESGDDTSVGKRLSRFHSFIEPLHYLLV